MEVPSSPDKNTPENLDRKEVWKQSKNFQLIKGSKTGHCCFRWSIIYRDDEVESHDKEVVGEFFGLEEAEMVLEALIDKEVE